MSEMGDFLHTVYEDKDFSELVVYLNNHQGMTLREFKRYCKLDEKRKDTFKKYRNYFMRTYFR